MQDVWALRGAGFDVVCTTLKLGKEWAKKRFRGCFFLLRANRLRDSHRMTFNVFLFEVCNEFELSCGTSHHFPLKSAIILIATSQLLFNVYSVVPIVISVSLIFLPIDIGK